VTGTAGPATWIRRGTALRGTTVLAEMRASQNDSAKAPEAGARRVAAHAEPRRRHHISYPIKCKTG
jgi:hypothetical protein